MKNTNNGIKLFLCLAPLAACVDEWPAPAIEDDGLIIADSRPVIPVDDPRDTHDGDKDKDKDKAHHFCEGPVCDGQTPQGTELEVLLIHQVSINGQAMPDVYVDSGELFAAQPNFGLLFRGAALTGAILSGPPAEVYLINDVVRVDDETAALDSSDSWHALFGNGVDQTTHLYSIKRQTVDGWEPACASANEPAFANWAIPIGAVWNEDGSRSESTRYFTFACMNGAVAKCYRWGYRPWVDSETREAHQACTRMVRADYCGDGASHTEDGTPIYIQDYNLPTMIRTFAGTPPSAVIEGLWGPDGAYCASQRRAGTDWPGWDVDLENWCGVNNAYGQPWEVCDPGDPTVHGLATEQTPYLANKSQWDPPIIIVP